MQTERCTRIVPNMNDDLPTLGSQCVLTDLTDGLELAFGV